MQNTNTVQGQFNATGAAVILAIPMGVDWIEVFNQTSAGGPNGTDGTSTTQRASDGTSYKWQVGMTAGTGLEEQTNAGVTASLEKYISTGGFTLVQNPLIVNGVLTNVTASFLTGATAFTITSATPPVLTVTGTPTALITNLTGLNVLRLSKIVAGGNLLNGIDFTFDTLAGTTTMTANLTNLTSSSAVTVGTQATINGVTTQPYWYPSTRNICNITSSGTNTVVTTTVTAPYVTGQTVRIVMPKTTPSGFSWGMPQINSLIGNVVAVTAAVAGSSAATFTLDIDSSSFTAFNKPGATGAAITTAGVQWCQVVPVGDVAAQIIDTSGNNISTNKFTQAQFNQGYIGIQLAGGSANQPAGRIVSEKADIVFWKAGKSFSNTVGIPTVPPLPPLGS